MIISIEQDLFSLHKRNELNKIFPDHRILDNERAMRIGEKYLVEELGSLIGVLVARSKNNDCLQVQIDIGPSNFHCVELIIRAIGRTLETMNMSGFYFARIIP